MKNLRSLLISLLALTLLGTLNLFAMEPHLDEQKERKLTECSKSKEKDGEHLWFEVRAQQCDGPCSASALPKTDYWSCLHCGERKYPNREVSPCNIL